MKTLLEKAKEVSPVRKVQVSEEKIELVIALLKQEISQKQALQALGLNQGRTTSLYSLIYQVVKRLYQQEKITLTN